MKWLNRCFWIAAWGVWLWLGFGLYRELPRPFGKPVCTLPGPDAGQWTFGFIGDTKEVVSIVLAGPPADLRPSTVNVIDAETGAVLRKTHGGAQPDGLLGDFNLQCRRGVLFSRLYPTKDGSLGADGVFVLDLKTMEWSVVSDRTVSNIVMHPTKPLIAFVGNFAPERSRMEAVVVDYRTRKETFICGEAGRRLNVAELHFLAEPDRLVITYKNDPRVEDGPYTLEIWNIESEPRCDKKIEDFPGRLLPRLSNNARAPVVFNSPTTSTADIYDFNADRFFFSNATDGRSRPSASWISTREAILLSLNGKSMLAGQPRTLWDVESGKPTWKSSSVDFHAATDSRDYFYYREDWHKFWESWLPNTKYKTFAYRSQETGGLVCRTTTQTQIFPERWNTTATLAIGADGNVHRLPLPVNWPLLALCQTILASPLVLLWLLSWWRRTRRARLTAKP